MNLAGRTALVTGGARRVGRAISRELAAAGAHVVVHHHSSGDAARALVEEIVAAGGSASAERADLRSLTEIQLLVRNVEVAVGAVDVLVNNASEFFETPLVTASDDDWDRLLDVNLKAPFRLCRRVAPPMTHRGSGVIVNVADVWGERPLRSHLVYSVSKAGLLMLTKGLARELAPAVRVNAVSPGTVLWPESYPEERRQRIRRTIPLGREGTPEDVARAVRFLCEEDYLTGAVLPVDGGKAL